MHVNKWSISLVLALLLLGTLACDATTAVSQLIAEATATATHTPRPTFTPLPTITNTPAPTDTATPVPPTFTPTKAPPTARPTARPATAAPKPPTAPPAPTISAYEFHANAPLPCQHSGMAFLKGTVYLNRSDPNSRYQGAIVALGPPDGSTIYDIVQTDGMGEYTFVLGDQGVAKPGSWGIWLVDPSHKRKSDIGGPITTNDLPADNPNSCWTSGVDFWK